MEPEERDLLIQKHLKLLNEALGHALPKVFPSEARLYRVVKDTAYFEVAQPKIHVSLKKAKDTIIKIIQNAGLKKVTQINIKTERGMYRSKTAKGILDIIPDPFKKKDDYEFRFAGQILERSEKVIKLNQQMAMHFGPPFPDNAQVIRIKDGVVTVYASSSAHAARLRLQSAQIIDTCKRLGYENLHTVKSKVAITHNILKHEKIEEVASPFKPHKSDEAARCVLSAASYIEDEGLSRALEKLGNHLKE